MSGECGVTTAHDAHPMPCDSGCQPDWHKDSCAIYGTCSGVSGEGGLVEVLAPLMGSGPAREAAAAVREWLAGVREDVARALAAAADDGCFDASRDADSDAEDRDYWLRLADAALDRLGITEGGQ